MNEIQEKKNFKEKVKAFWGKNKSKVIADVAFIAGVAGTLLTKVVIEKIGEHNAYEKGTDFTRYMMDKGYTSNEAKIWKHSEIHYINDTEDCLGIPLREKWAEYREEHPEEFIQW